MEKFVYTVRYSARGRVRGRNFYLRAGPVIKTIIEYSINGESPFSLVFVTYSISESCRDELSSGIKASRKAIRNGMEESFLSLSFFSSNGGKTPRRFQISTFSIETKD